MKARRFGVSDLGHVLPGHVEDVRIVVGVEEALDLLDEGRLLRRELEVHPAFLRCGVGAVGLALWGWLALAVRTIGRSDAPSDTGAIIGRNDQTSGPTIARVCRASGGQAAAAGPVGSIRFCRSYAWRPGPGV